MNEHTLTLRTAIFKTVFGQENDTHIDKFNEAFKEVNGNLEQALHKVTTAESVEHSAIDAKSLGFVNDLAVVTNDDEPLVVAIWKQAPEARDFRQLALHFGINELKSVVQANSAEIPRTASNLNVVDGGVRDGTDGDAVAHKVALIRKNLFKSVPTAVVQRMVQDNEIALPKNSSPHINDILAENPSFNIRTTPVSQLLKSSSSFKALNDQQKLDVESDIKSLQRTQALSSDPEAFKQLAKHGLTSSLQVSNIPEDVFVNGFGATLGSSVEAVNIHRHAVASRIRAEQFLTSTLQAVRGSGFRVIDGGHSKANVETRKATFAKLSLEVKTQVTLEKLFGSLDYCECSDCNSVYSPAAYFVELLEFLRHNNLDANNTHSDDPTNIEGTQLEQLFLRRPDLRCVQLTCENTNTLIPYIDLALEVMESYVVYSTTKAFNVDDETSSELLCSPQNTNLAAYEVLRRSVFPFRLPYNFAIDTMRVFLNFLKTSRAELLDTFRADALTRMLHPDLIDDTVQRAYDAEFNLLSQEEYVILTKEAFRKPSSSGHGYTCCCADCNKSRDEYTQQIDLRQAWEYYGYNTEAEMKDPVNGLMWVKHQFLKKTGIQYTDLVSMLKTRYINPNMPRGKALTTMDHIRFSYRFLAYLVQPKFKDKRRKFQRLIQFLCLTQPLIPLIEWARDKDDLCTEMTGNLCSCAKPKSHCSCTCCNDDEWSSWVYDWFEKIGKCIVLESGEGPRLPIEGRVWAEPQTLELRARAVESTATNGQNVQPGALSRTFIGILGDDGAIISKEKDGDAVAFVAANGLVIDLSGKPLIDSWKQFNIRIYNTDKDAEEFSNVLGYIGRYETMAGKLMYRPPDSRSSLVAQYSPAQDTCNIEKVKIQHLDGSNVEPDEYDRMQRFLRLWQKLGWTMNETDDAIAGLGKSIPSTNSSSSSSNYPTPSSSTYEDVSQPFADTPNQSTHTGISTNLVHQLVAVKKLLDMTGLELGTLLSFWTDIPSNGEKSLYERLFLTHNLLRMDPVFKADEDGNYLTGSEKIVSHLTVLQAALRLKPDDTRLILQKPEVFKIAGENLDIASVSALYRWASLAKVLSIRIDQVEYLVDIFGHPFTDAQTTLTWLENWQSMIDSGFTFPQFKYLILGKDDISYPLAPSQLQILRLTKTISDNLAAIETQQPDITKEDVDNNLVSLADILPAKLALVFSPDASAKILQFINGQYSFVTNAPPRLSLQGDLPSKVKYVEDKTADPPSAQLVVTGILSDDEADNTKAVSNHPQWAPAVDRIRKQAGKFYKQYLESIFPPDVDGTVDLLKPDSADSPPQKAMALLKYFMPLIRATISRQMIETTVSDTFGLTPAMVSYLLSTGFGASTPAINDLLALKVAPSSLSAWDGYIIAPTTDVYVFTVKSDTPPPSMTIDDVSLAFPNQSEDPSDLWSSGSISLVAGKLYHINLNGMKPSQLFWNVLKSSPVAVPASALLPSFSSDKISTVLNALFKLSILIQGFNFSVDELVFFHDHPQDFASAVDGKELDLSAITLGTWKRLRAYTLLRDKLPKQSFRLIDFFSWANLNESRSDAISVQIAKLSPAWDLNYTTALLTGWKALNLASMKNEVALLQLQKALTIVKKLQIDVNTLFDWAKPLTVSDKSYEKLVRQAQALKDTLHSRYLASDWEQAAKPLFDTLRKNQRDALVAYLVVEDSLVQTGVVNDADGLFEYFLIDCQMSSCLQTSRIKQAIATVQLYVQRCLLGLEQEVATVDSDKLSRSRWLWMQRYVLWEANRRVFLYPENWIEPSLRDDKTPFFLDLESALQQKDVSLPNAVEALKLYIYAVSSVANMRVYGLFVTSEGSADKPKLGVHITARRTNAPYDWYSREYSPNGEWSPWIRIPVDIPTYDVEDGKGRTIGSGPLVASCLWHDQPIIFFLQMIRKNIPAEMSQNMTMEQHFHSDSPNQDPPIPVWEMRLGFSMFQNGKWSQKQLSSDSLRHKATKVQILDPKVSPPNPDPNQQAKIDTYELPDQTSYQMVPRLITGTDAQNPQINIDVWYGKENLLIGRFIFVNGGVGQAEDAQGGAGIGTNTFFQFKPNGTKFEIHSFQSDDAQNQPLWQAKPPMVEYDQAPVAGSKSVISITDANKYTFNHTFIDPLLKYISVDTKIEDLYAQFATFSEAAAGVDQDDPFGKLADGSYNEKMSPYGIYNWEIGLHALMVLIDGLLNAQQFDDCLTICHKIFDPSAVGAAGAADGDNSRYWKFFPFKSLANTDAKQTLDSAFLALQSQTPDDAISDWRDHPYSPHAVARNRPVAYMKWIAMKYIEVMIAYGDYYFRQNSLETIPNAIQCYVIASHVYGPRSQKIPKRGKTKPQTYNSLLKKWDAFGNAVVQLEVEFPFSNQTALPIGSSNGVTGFSNIFGFASSLYFCIPDNPKLRDLRATIDDRLFKIRNCMDINGVVRQLPLWDPPIDPALLVQAVAQGLSIDTVLNDISGPIPNYRFQLLMQKSLEVCSELKSLGSALLTIKEKKDSETLANLRASHETVINTLMLDIKNRQLDEANKSLDQLQRSREAPAYRLQFYKFLVGLTDKAPAEEDDFNEIANPSLQAPVVDSDLILLTQEKEEMDKAQDAKVWNMIVGGTETLSAIFTAWPTAEAAAKPMGAGAGLYWGGMNMGQATSAVARGLSAYTGFLSATSTAAGRKAGLLRALQDRVFQANVSGHELKNIDRSILVQQIRANTADQEIKNQQKQLDQVTQVEEFLRSKYTNDELYTWMDGMTKTLYKQAYSLAFDLAKRAEKAFNFERPQLRTSFINMGYWNNARDGLLAGEQLYLGLKQLESAYQESLGHDFETTKLISIRQWAPLALVELRDSGVFELSVPEILFDMDFPGHYLRRITSVAVTVPCIVGPYTSINLTLRLLSHTIRIKPRATKADYPEQTSDTGDVDDRFSTNNVPISAVVLSTGQNDTGRHDSSLSDRYSPFEGAGVISRWRFELPSGFRQFDYSSITDIIMHIRYTSCDGGDNLKSIAADAVASYVKAMSETSLDGDGLYTFFDLKTEFASEWYGAFIAPRADADQTKPRELRLSGLAERLPLFTKGTDPSKISALSIAIITRGGNIEPSNVSVSVPPNGMPEARFVPGGINLDLKELTAFTSKGTTLPMTDWIMRVSGGSESVDGLTGMWMVVKYAFSVPS